MTIDLGNAELTFDKMNEINIFDRMGILLFWGSDSALLDHLAINLTDPLVWVPFFLTLLYIVLHNHSNKRERLVCIAAVCVTLALSAGVCNFIVKPLVCRVRPCNVPELREMFHVVKGYAENNYSFFSSHSANYTALATFFILLVRHKVMTAVMVALALINMWTRLYLGQHYLSDICVGMLWGIVSGYIGWRVYKNCSHQEFQVSELAPTGFKLQDIYISALVFMCTLFLVMLL